MMFIGIYQDIFAIGTYFLFLLFDENEQYVHSSSYWYSLELQGHTIIRTADHYIRFRKVRIGFLFLGGRERVHWEKIG